MTRRAGDDGVRVMAVPVASSRAFGRVWSLVWVLVLVLPACWVALFAIANLLISVPGGRSTMVVGSWLFTPSGLIRTDRREELSKAQQIKSLADGQCVPELVIGVEHLTYGTPIAFASRIRYIVLVPDPRPGQPVKRFAGIPGVRGGPLYTGDVSEVRAVAWNYVQENKSGAALKLFDVRTKGGAVDVDAIVPNWGVIIVAAVGGLPLSGFSVMSLVWFWQALRGVRISRRWELGECPACGYPLRDDRFAVCSECGMRVVATSERGA